MKENRIKKALSLLLAVIMLAVGLPFATMPAGAEDGSFTEGYYTYTVEKGKAKITDCDESISGDVVIPSELGGYPVTSISGRTISVTDITDTFIGAFEGCNHLSEVTIPNSVKYIECNAFKNCTALTKIKIPKLYIIPKYMFKGCTSLTDVTFSEGITIIEEEAFSGCTALANIKLPNGVSIIEKDAFYNTAYYNTKSNWDNGVLYLDYFLLKASKNIPNVYSIKNGTRCIAYKPFTECCDLKEITIPGSVKTIGEYTFENCTSLNKVTLLNGIVDIKNYAFRSCTSLNNITLSETLKLIGPGAFRECSSLEEINIPESVENICFSAFSMCSKLEKINVDVANNNYCSVDGIVFNKEKTILVSYPSGKAESSYSIPNTVDSIEASSFSGCVNLEELNIPNSVTCIEDCAFKHCELLKNIKISNSINRICSGVFQYCYSLTNIIIPDGVIEIGDYAFYGCTSLTSVSIPTSVRIIDWHSLGFYYDEENDVTAKIPDFTIYGYTGTAAETYANENGFTFIALDDEHTHTFSAWTVTKEATCTAEGVETRTCSGCGATETKKIEKKEHSLTHVEEDSTCKIQGISYDICDMCGNTFNYSVLPLAPHTFGEWKVTKEATSFEYGERMRSCSVCGFEEKESIEKLPVSEIKDEKTGISVICPNGSYDDKVEIEVTETFDGTSYHVLNAEKGNFKKSLFDISTTINGEKVQPNGSVFVKIPLPEEYNAEKTYVYYVTNDGKLERIPSRIEDGYIIFETTHFSYYAIVDETEKEEPVNPPKPENPSNNCSCICHKGGISAFFYKIARVFWKLFKVKRTCACNAAHY